MPLPAPPTAVLITATAEANRIGAVVHLPGKTFVILAAGSSCRGPAVFGESGVVVLFCNLCPEPAIQYKEPSIYCMTRLTYYIAWIGFLAFGFLAWHFMHKGRQEERNILIQKGIDVGELLKKSDKRRQLWLLKIGIIIIGLGVSFILIAVLDSLHLLHPDAVYPGIFCLGLGTSFVIAYQVGKKSNES